MTSCDNPSVENDSLMTKRRRHTKLRLCLKCKSNPGNIAVRNAIYCKDCFFPLTTMKFRRSLEPHINAVSDGPRKKALKPTGHLLLGFSGGLGSTVLLDLVERSYFTAQDVPVGADGSVKGGRDHPRNEPIWRRSFVAYVEVCAAFAGMRDRTDDIRAELERHHDFETIVLRLEDAFDHSWWESAYGGALGEDVCVDLGGEELLFKHLTEDIDDPKSHLKKYLSSLPTPTAFVSAVQTLTRVLLLYTARARRCSHVLLGTSLTSLSISLISSISQGAGFAVHEEAQEEWQPPPSQHGTSEDDMAPYTGPIRMIRPLQDLSIKECAVWAWWSGLRVVGSEKWSTEKQGIGSLTKAFIINLERDYPATVSTIAKTCAKLASRSDAHARCVLCERPAQETAQAWKERISIRDLDEQARTTTTVTDELTLASWLCYACHTTLTSRSARASTRAAADGTARHPVPLPSWTVNHLRRGRPSEGHHDATELVESDRTTSQRQEVWTTRPMSERDMLTKVNDFILDE